MDTGLKSGRVASASERSRIAAAIYYVSPLLAGPLREWQAHLDQAARLGFSHVLIAPPFLPGPGGDLFLTADHHRLHPALAWDGDARAGLRFLAEACRERGLGLLVDVSVDRLAADSPAARARPDLFAAPDTALRLDPRGPHGGFEAATARADNPDLPDWWAHVLAGFIDGGVGGFRLLGLQHLPATAVAGLVGLLRAQNGSCMTIGWTAGLDRARLDALRGAGLDFVSSSLPWWDFRASWLWEEDAALTRVAPVLAAPEAPFAERLSSIRRDPALLRTAYLRALRFAATAPAWLLPMGYEYAATEAMDPARDTPEAMARLRASAPFDLSAEIAEANQGRQAAGALLASRAPRRLLTGPGAPVIGLLRGDTPDLRRADHALLTLANADLERRTPVAASSLLVAAGARFTRFDPVVGEERALFSAGDVITLGPGEVALFTAAADPLPRRAPQPLDLPAEKAARAPRIAIESVTPAVDEGRFPVKRIAGEVVAVEADVIADGHDILGVALLWRRSGDAAWHETRMRPLGNDRWQASFPLSGLGEYEFTVEAWRDEFATFRDELAKKHAAGLRTWLEVQEGSALVHEAARAAKGPVAASLVALSDRLSRADEDTQRGLLLAPETAEVMASADRRPFAIRAAPPFPVQAEREGARFASWYEIFPRSMSDDVTRHGTFADVIRHLPRIRDMGFDVLYFPPIHPIGRTNRKGRNNSLNPAPDDPGSPYATGSTEGGHDALHPQLGTFEDFERLRVAAAEHGLELAIDFAIQCAPDHPWLREHPEWFAFRPDGSLRYAENPPKKYEDIVNVDFYAPAAIPSLWTALAEVVLFWAERGVRLFRVDNPHTKPLPFWEWMIAEVRAQYPDTIFLAEAFTRPKVMYRLAKIGFSQSYTYFTWRNTKRELQDYLVELTTKPPREFFRPHFFVNTPDINPIFLQDSGRGGFLIRAALAATMSGLWGVYNGFELCEGRALPGREEYADSEKYQFRAWDWDRPGNIVAEIATLNRIRRNNPALHTHLGIVFHPASSDLVLFYVKASPDRSNVLLIVVSLDPRGAQEADLEVPLWEWGLPDDGALEVEDLVSGTVSTWRGKRQHVRLDPLQPYAIWRARAAA